jgi:hypothetical protein
VEIAPIARVAKNGSEVTPPLTHVRGLVCLGAVKLPGYSELIDEHAKTNGPEGLLERHLNGSVFGQHLKHALGLYGVIDVKQDVKTLRLFILLGEDVGALQSTVADGQSGMDDVPAPLRRHLFRHGRIGIGEHKLDFAAQAPFIKLKSGLALTVKSEVWIQFHGVLLERSCRKWELGRDPAFGRATGQRVPFERHIVTRERALEAKDARRSR